MDFRGQKHEAQVTTAGAIRLGVFIYLFFFFLSSSLERTETCVGSPCEGPPRPSHPPSLGKSVHLFRRLFILINLSPRSVIFSGTASCSSRKKSASSPFKPNDTCGLLRFILTCFFCLFCRRYFFLSFYSDLSHSHKHHVSLCSSRCRGNCR